MNEVIEFIKRRFKTDCNWLSGNCYYFALILQDRFPGGKILYDVINGHFVYWYNGSYYDWTGKVNPDGVLVDWRNFSMYDESQRNVIVRDCIK